METASAERSRVPAVAVTSSDRSSLPARRGGMPSPARAVTVLAGALLVGIVSSLGQQNPVAAHLATTAVGPWVLVLTILVLVARAKTLLRSALVGIVFAELAEIGYVAASLLSSHAGPAASAAPWFLIAVPVGALAGLFATWWCSGGAKRAFVSGGICAILVGEGISALLQVTDDVGDLAWTIEISVGVLIVVAGIIAARNLACRVVALGTAVVGTTVVFGMCLIAYT